MNVKFGDSILLMRFKEWKEWTIIHSVYTSQEMPKMRELGIHLFLQILVQTKLRRQLRRYLQAILVQCSIMLKLMTNLLTIKKIAGFSLELNAISIDNA